MDTIVLVVNLLVNFWLLIIIQRQCVRKQLPWFALYIVWECVAACIQLVLWLASARWYNKLYWWIEVIELALIVAAVRESFLRLFQGFTRKTGFRWSVWAVIGGVVVYSAWKAVYAPPALGNKLGVFEVGAEFLFRWAVIGIALLTTILGFLLKESPDTREEAVVAGFGTASAGFLAYVISFSIFGTKYIFLTKYAPTVGYFLAAFWWIWVFSRPEEQFGFEELGMGPEDIARVLRRYREFGDRL